MSETNGAATRNDFSEFAKRKVSRYRVPALGKDVYLRTITQAELMDVGTGELRSAKMIAYALCDEHGDQLFSENEHSGDLEEIAAWQAGVSAQVIALIDQHCGLNATIEELVGNSETAPSA